MDKTIIILPNNLGDVIMTLPLLQGLKEQNPERNVTFFVEEGYDGGLVESPFCDHIFRFIRKEIKKQLNDAAWENGCEQLQWIINQVRENIELPCEVINLSQHDYTSYLTALLHGTKTVGRRFLAEGNHSLPDKWSQYLYAIPFARQCNKLHATDVYCRIAGVNPGKQNRRIVLSVSEKDNAMRFLQQRGVSSLEERTIVFQPGAAYASKRWPPEHFIMLGNLLTGEGYRIVITGAPAEKELAQQIAAGIQGNIVVTAGDCSFRKTIALLDSMKCVISGDTATMHAAAALGKKVVALFGPTSPVETGPYGEGHIIVAGTCPKRPCFNAVCNDHRCMRSIPPELVFKCVKEEVSVNSEAGVFETSVTGGGYKLKSAGSAYYQPVTADFVQAVFEENDAGGITVDDNDRNESQLFCAVCSQMENTLEQYLLTRNSVLLSRYEQYRSSLAGKTGVTAFWSALLNIRLNSIPLLDPAKGVMGSIDAIKQTRQLISREIA